MSGDEFIEGGAPPRRVYKTPGAADFKAAAMKKMRYAEMMRKGLGIPYFPMRATVPGAVINLMAADGGTGLRSLRIEAEGDKEIPFGMKGFLLDVEIGGKGSNNHAHIFITYDRAGTAWKGEVYNPPAGPYFWNNNKFINDGGESISCDKGRIYYQGAMIPHANQGLPASSIIYGVSIYKGDRGKKIYAIAASGGPLQFWEAHWPEDGDVWGLDSMRWKEFYAYTFTDIFPDGWFSFDDSGLTAVSSLSKSGDPNTYLVTLTITPGKGQPSSGGVFVQIIAPDKDITDDCFGSTITSGHVTTEPTISSASGTSSFFSEGKHGIVTVNGNAIVGIFTGKGFVNYLKTKIDGSYSINFKHTVYGSSEVDGYYTTHSHSDEALSFIAGNNSKSTISLDGGSSFEYDAYLGSRSLNTTLAHDNVFDPVGFDPDGSTRYSSASQFTRSGNSTGSFKADSSSGGCMYLLDNYGEEFLFIGIKTTITERAGVAADFANTSFINWSAGETEPPVIYNYSHTKVLTFEINITGIINFSLSVGGKIALSPAQYNSLPGVRIIPNPDPDPSIVYSSASGSFLPVNTVSAKNRVKAYGESITFYAYGGLVEDFILPQLSGLGLDEATQQSIHQELIDAGLTRDGGSEQIILAFSGGDLTGIVNQALSDAGLAGVSNNYLYLHSVTVL